MEAVGLGISIASIVSILQTCVAGYRTLNTALELGESAVGLSLRFRLEETRLRLWAKNRGIDVQDEQESAPSITQLRKDDVLEIPAIRQLVAEILGRMLQVLDRYTKITDKYKQLKNDQSLKDILSKGDPLSLSFSQILKFKGGLGHKEQDISQSHSFSSKLRWGLKDKEALEELLAELVLFNDGLESLLPRRETIFISQSLMGEVVQLPIDLQRQPQTSVLSDKRIAGIVDLRRLNKTNLPEDNSGSSTRRTAFKRNRVTQRFDGVELQDESLIDTASFESFIPPRIKYAHGFERSGDCILDVPPTRSIYLYSGNSSSGTREYVMVEWRSQQAESAYSKISSEVMEARRKHLVGVLRKTAMTDNGFRVLDCLGYTLTEGHLPNGQSHPLVGFVYRLPRSSSNSAVPVTLREIIEEAYHSEETQIPTLDDRYRLAYVLATALYQLHCAGWIHRKISSYNILFFPDPSSGVLDFTKPFICGWQYARPDHWTKTSEATQLLSEKADARRGENIFGRGAFGLGDLEMYIHPDRLDYENGVPLFRRSYDIYSLGVILAEIAFWEPIMVLCGPEEREKMARFEAYSSPLRLSWSKTVIDVVKKELGSEMGTVYQNAVRFCLEGRKGFNEKQRVGYEEIDQKDQAKQDVGQLEPGIEKEFFWMVVEELGRISE